MANSNNSHEDITMTKNPFKYQPGVVMGYRKNGKPFYAIAGAEDNPAVQVGDVSTTVPGTFTTSTSTSTAPAFTAADLERVRQEEKDKLYGRLTQQDEKFNAMQAEVERLAKERDDKLAEEAARANAAEEALRKQREEEMSAKELLEERDKAWTERFTQFEQERDLERAGWAKEQEFTALANYAQQKLTEHADDIAPELRKFVTGNSQQEIDSSIATVIATTNDMVKAMQDAMAVQGLVAQVPQSPGVSATGYAPTGPMDVTAGQQKYTVADINAMTPQEYAEKVRPHLGLGKTQGQGMYGRS